MQLERFKVTESLMLLFLVLFCRHLEGHDGSLDDIDTFVQLMFIDDKRRGQSDDVTVGGLGQQSIVTKTQTHFPGVIV